MKSSEHLNVGRRACEGFLAALLPLVILSLAACGSPPSKAEAQPQDEPQAAAESTAPTEIAVRVGILAMDGIFNTELVGPYDIFDHAPGWEVFTVAPERKTLVSAEGLRFEPDFEFGEHPDIDVLVIPSFEDFREHLKNPQLLAWIKEQADAADHVLSHCWGAFYLAAAGLLDGRHATTFPTEIDELQKTFPNVHAEKGVRFVHDGKFLTSVGGTASFESPLYLLRVVEGNEMAKRVAGGLVIDDWKQEGLSVLIVDD